MGNSKGCMKTCIISFIAVYIFIMAYAFVVHGMLFKADYDALMSSGITRTMEQMQSLSWVCWLLHAVIAAASVCLFKKFRKGMAACKPEAACISCPIRSGGVCFGMKIGLIMGSYMAFNYIWWPIPGMLAVKWFISEFVMGVGIGAILGMICKPSGSCDVTPAA